MSISDQALLDELNNDPTALGYKAGGVFKSTAEIAALLTHTPHVPNPDPQPNVPAPLSATTLLGSLSEASAVNLTAYPALERLYDDILAGNRAAVRLTVAMLAAAKKVQVSEAAAILAHLDETVPDPNWPAEVPGVCRIMALGNGGFADYAQINKVLGRG